MKTNRPACLKALAALCVAIGLGRINAATLSIGDPAPHLQVSKWIQGEPVKEFARDKVYVVEFWATWCGPCRVSIPHVNALHEKFKNRGLVVIGQDVREETPEAVAPFVKEMGTNMTYRVALDAADGAMAAIELQERAVKLAKGRRKEQFQETLDGYKAGRLPGAY